MADDKSPGPPPTGGDEPPDGRGNGGKRLQNSGRIKGGEVRNPWGRAGKPRPASFQTRPEDVFLEEAERRVRPKIGDRYVTMPVFKAVARRVWSEALTGPPAAAREAFRIYRDAHRAREAYQREIITGVVEMKERAREWERENRSIEQWPHSSDIIATPGRQAVTGPTTEELARAFRETRDLHRLITWSEHDLDEALTKTPDDADLLEQRKYFVKILKKLRHGFGDATIKGQPVIEPIEKILSMKRPLPDAFKAATPGPRKPAEGEEPSVKE